MATNILIGFNSWRNQSTFQGVQLAPTDSAWVSDATYPLADNAGRQPFSRVARATGTRVQFATFFDRPRRVGVSALVRHNLGTLATMRRRYYADAALSMLLYDTGWFEVWPEAYPLDQCEWEDDEFWDGKEPEESRAGYCWTRPNILPEIVMPAAVVTDIIDDSNPAGYVEFGLDEQAQGWESSVNPDFGFEPGFAFQTTARRTHGGRQIFDRRDKPRTWAGVLDYLPKDEHWAKAWELLRRTDLDTPFLFIPDPGDEANWLRQAGMYTSVDPGASRWIDVDAFSFPFKFEEALD